VSTSMVESSLVTARHPGKHKRSAGRQRQAWSPSAFYPEVTKALTPVSLVPVSGSRKQRSVKSMESGGLKRIMTLIGLSRGTEYDTVDALNRMVKRLGDGSKRFGWHFAGAFTRKARPQDKHHLGKNRWRASSNKARPRST